jgi:hypothetical protein
LWKTTARRKKMPVNPVEERKALMKEAMKNENYDDDHLLVPLKQRLGQYNQKVYECATIIVDAQRFIEWFVSENKANGKSCTGCPENATCMECQMKNWLKKVERSAGEPQSSSGDSAEG